MEIERIYDFLWEKKLRHGHLAQLCISRGEPGILDIDIQLNYLKIKWIQTLTEFWTLIKT